MSAAVPGMPILFGKFRSRSSTFFSPKENIDRVTTVTEMSSVFRLRALPTQIEEGACHPLRHGTELNWRGGIQDKI